MREGTFPARMRDEPLCERSRVPRQALPRWMGVEGFVDLHFHLIPGVDDGPDSAGTALDLALAAYAEGTLGIVATPHRSKQYPFRPLDNVRELEALEQRCPDDLAVFGGCELELTNDGLRAFRRAPRVFTLNGGSYVLVEFAGHKVPAQAEAAFRVISEMGFTPVLAHPERYPQLAGQMDRLAGWVREGCLLQLTAASLLGRMGRRAEALGWEMLAAGVAHFVASDAHHIAKRPPSLIEAYGAVAQRMGVPLAARLFTHNPLRVLRDEALGA